MDVEHDSLAWLAHRLLRSGDVSEGEVAHVLGVDRLRVRELADHGSVVDERIRTERLARARTALAARCDTCGGPTVRVHGHDQCAAGPCRGRVVTPCCEGVSRG